MTQETVWVPLPSGDRSPALVWAGELSKPLVMIWPGLGVGASYYRPLAEELHRRGYPVAVGELRGHGESTARASRSNNWGYHDLAAQDYPLTLRAVKEHLELPMAHPTVLLTHSMGGQIGVLFLARPEARELGLRAMMGVGSGSPYLPSFPTPMRRRIRTGTLLMGGFGKVLGYWPGKIAGWDPSHYGRQAGRHMWEWGKLAWRNTYADLSGADVNYPAALAQVKLPVLLCYFDNDDSCPEASARSLAEHLPAAQIQCGELAGGLGHNRWARQPQIVVDRLEEFYAGL
ncbi:alpha/beta fold hydrolase [Corynebacterium lowii]|uniref:Alpha/beta hydrolase family protein n=1 Tax=Corynebacterium lowii TaxID=1544413 RepID=A0A0Q0U530_9CORY|nr:alpha/beta fold hydrolase [Corynebacterium lowii]KQB87043.1 Alpha/beta hydrolase family protein [Corynebacterium lowii]MDP9852375.1 putative alpha/beta hydrolase [Corynebacterium lowii]